MGDDPDEHVRRIDDRNGDQVIFVDLTRNRFLILVDAGEDHVVLHDVFDHGRSARQDQLLERHKANQPALVIDDVTVINGLTVGGLMADELERFTNGDMRRQRDVVGRHGRARGAGLIAGQPADIFALGLRQERKDRVDHVFTQPVDQVGTLVVRHQVEEFSRLFRRHRLDKAELAVFVQVTEDVSAIAGRQDPEKGVAVVGLEVLDDLGEPPGVVVGEEVAQGGDLAVADQFAEVGHQERMSHGPSSDFVGSNAARIH